MFSGEKNKSGGSGDVLATTKYRDLVAIVAASTGYKSTVIEEVSEAFLIALVDTLRQGNKVRLGAIGTMRAGAENELGNFSIKYSAPR
ncbi:MAG: HU family DNA-binding protein [Alphaproteobacteria bacterium]|nr:HU family DNA-binding protein [Alphaproteobacteria bacterium]